MNLLGEAWLSFAKWEILPTLPGDSDLFQIRHGHGLTRPGDRDEHSAPVGRVGHPFGQTGAGQSVDQDRHARLGQRFAFGQVRHAQRALGLEPGSFDAPEFIAALEDIRQACISNGIVAAIHCFDGKTAARYVEQGFGMVTVAVELRLLRAALAAELVVARAAVAP